ncbi:acyl-CoA carboxylase subunit epsilon [Streptomyces sp. NBC_00320]|uniref:acyl-CoA carboxylase subunit epsilon n=1 Tax=unclassified Streptomyces TaxID=2593676 RepID=UPI002B1E6B0B|nr:acyl-CoA carboxylase subunit epsilon [Streptomyces sp. NBC_00320]
MAGRGADPRAQDPAGVLVIHRHRIRVVRGSPDHIELAALTAALVILARTAPVPRAPHSTRHRRAHWDRNLASVVHHPAHSWRARPGSPFV